MKKNSLLVICLFHVCIIMFGQEKWAFIGLNSEVNDHVVEEVIPIVNSESDHVAVFFKVKKTYICYLLNDKQEIIKTLKIDSIPNNFEVLAGSAYSSQKFTLYFSNGSKTQHGCIYVDFEEGTHTIFEELDLDLKKERLISYVENGNEFYALSVQKSSSMLNLYRFDMTGKVVSIQYDLSNEIFETDNELPITLDALMFGKHSDGTVEALDTSIPNTLETTAALTKVYTNGSTLMLTNNTFQKFTYLIQLDIKEKTARLSKIENKQFDKKYLRNNSNSFVFNSLFFDTYSNTDEIIFNVYDIQNTTLLKNFHIKAGDSIPFKNTPFIHEVLNTNSYRDLEKTARFIRKVNTSNIGISVYPYDDKYVLTLGASEKIKSSEFAIIGGLLGGMVGAALLSAFDSYNRTQSTRIECLFDSSFNHIEGDIPKNGFDLIYDFISEKNLKRAKLQTVFRYKDTFIWASYNQPGKYYSFYQFNPN